MKLHELKDAVFGEDSEKLKEVFGENEELAKKFITSGKRVRLAAKSKHKRNRGSKKVQ